MDKDLQIAALKAECAGRALECDRLRAILYNVALSMGAEDSEQFIKHIGWTHTAAK